MGKDVEARMLLAIFGYDPDDPVPRNADGRRVIPDRLIDAVRRAPLVPEWRVRDIRNMTSARACERSYARRRPLEYLRKRRYIDGT